MATLAMRDDTAAERQLRLDPVTTEVDGYDPIRNPTGDINESSDERNDNVSFNDNLYLWSDANGDLPLLTTDYPRNKKGSKTARQKARERGWGEVLFDSYSSLLLQCEARLNAPFSKGKVSSNWMGVLGMPPSKWSAHTVPKLEALDEKTFRAAVSCVWFPVHAMGYNWLRENKESGIAIAERITALIKHYQGMGFQCEKVILVTHSMGGLVARAVIHPEMGGIDDKILGIVHGVMPAIGAGAAYKRMRCGVEGDDIAAKIIGNTGTLMTAVLGNAQGGLELLPSQAYGNHWLQVKHKGKIIKSLPTKGDPYEEIYKLKDKWYGLLKQSSLNPADMRNGPSFAKTCVLLDKAKKFHNEINNTYHDQSYAHYGADAARAAWHNVVWAIDGEATIEDVDSLKLALDSDQGALSLVNSVRSFSVEEFKSQLSCKMVAASDPGDQTVPMFSADHQLRSGKFKGIFRQRGYEHQNSYKDSAALDSTLYSLIRIASTMNWSK